MLVDPAIHLAAAHLLALAPANDAIAAETLPLAFAVHEGTHRPGDGRALALLAAGRLRSGVVPAVVLVRLDGREALADLAIVC